MNKLSDLTTQEAQWVEEATMNQQHGWTHLRISGEPLKRGFQHGFLLSEHYKKAVETYRFITMESFGVPYSFFVEAAVKLHKDKLGQEITEEMNGIAQGLTKAGVPSSLDDIIGWNAWIEMTGSWWPTAKGNYAAHGRTESRKCKCSSIIATGSATEDGGIVLAHETFDDFWNGANINIILEIWPTEGAGMIMQSSPCYIASMTDFFVTGHLVGSETTIAGFTGYDETGVPEYVRARNAMQYGTDINSFVELINKGNNGGYANTWLVGDINTSEIAEYQQGLKYQKLTRQNDGYIAGANYVTDPQIRNLECQFTGYNDIRQQTGARRTRWPQIVEPHLGKITGDTAKAMLADHFDLYSDKEWPCATTICAHYDEDPRYYMSSPEAVENAPFVAMGSMDGKVTTTSLAKEMKMWGRYGRACGAAFDADAYLKQHPQWGWMKGHLPSRPSQPWSLFAGTGQN